MPDCPTIVNYAKNVLVNYYDCSTDVTLTVYVKDPPEGIGHCVIPGTLQNLPVGQGYLRAMEENIPICPDTAYLVDPMEVWKPK